MAKAPEDDGLSGHGLGTRTARSKFIEVVKGAAEFHHLELVVDPDGPNSGYGYIQKHDHFSNLYAFHFEFGDASAVFYLGTESTKELGDEKRKQVEYSDGKRMEFILEEIRNKISEVAGEVYPRLSSLSRRTAAPPAAPADAPPTRPSAKGDAIVWGQDDTTMARDRYRYKEMPRRSYATTIVLVVLLLLVLFTLAPVLSTNGGITSCHAASCQTSATYYQSPSFRALGVGMVYVPQSHGWGTFGTGTLQAANGTLMRGIGMLQFYVVW